MKSPAKTPGSACDVQFGQVGLANLRVRTNDPDALQGDLAHRVRKAPHLFQRSAVVVDFSHLGGAPGETEAQTLLQAVQSAGMLPVGLAYGDSATDTLARRLGLPVISGFREALEQQVRSADNAPPQAPEPAPAPSAPPPAPTGETPAATVGKQHLQPVRSGQQLYARDRDLIITDSVAHGAEVIADGCIHVYGKLRGRALAGARGNPDARIFCSDFRAELVSIAGHYRVFESIPDELAGRAIQCRLEGDKLLLEPL